MYEVSQLIAGSRRLGGSGRELIVISPSDGSPVTRVAVSDETDVQEAVAAALSAAPDWARTAPAARAAALHAAAD
ncbi:aldehyde dehydrogenase family protein, partial [Actinoplanes cyaneus]|uniref:aldehyde dehydrogenase family protein n=1 Tax=Actinoplanes cyaneus TaxID=52696 RepID=UPI0031D86180